MSTVVICDDEIAGSRIRAVLVGMGRDCPASHVVRPDRARDVLKSSKPELGVLVIGSDPEKGRSVLGEVRPFVPGHLVVVGGLSGPKAVVQILRAGADDYIDQADIEEELSSVVDSLTSGRRESGREGRVVAILSPSGGGGASTLAVNLAACQAKENGTAALIDLRIATGDLASLLDLKPIHSLADLFSNSDRLDALFLERTLTRHDCGVSLLASPRRYDTEPFDSAGISRILELVRTTFPTTIVDVDSALGPESLQALREADGVVVVLRLEFGALCNARLALDHLERNGIPRDKILVVANRHGQPREVPVAKAKEALNIEFAALLPDEPKVVIRANNNGAPVVRESPSSRYAKGVVRLAATLATRFQPAA